MSWIDMSPDTEAAFQSHCAEVRANKREVRATAAAAGESPAIREAEDIGSQPDGGMNVATTSAQNGAGEGAIIAPASNHLHSKACAGASMSKPDDIPQDVWDEARDMSLDAFISDDTATTQRMIARAIMAAEKRGEEREREACALVAAERRKIFVSGPDVRTSVTFSPTEVVAAIRKRGEG